MRYVVYKYTFSILIFTFYDDSRIHAIPEGKNTIIPGLKYTLFSLIFGWWGLPMGPAKVLQTLLENFSGGKDVTDLVERTNQGEPEAIYSGLSESHQYHASIELIEEILDIQEEVLNKNPENERGLENAEFVHFALQQFGHHDVGISLVEEILEADYHYHNNMNLAMGYRIANKNLS